MGKTLLWFVINFIVVYMYCVTHKWRPETLYFRRYEGLDCSPCAKSVLTDFQRKKRVKGTINQRKNIELNLYSCLCNLTVLQMFAGECRCYFN